MSILFLGLEWGRLPVVSCRLRRGTNSANRGFCWKSCCWFRRGGRGGIYAFHRVGCCLVGARLGPEGATVGLWEGLDVGWPVGWEEGFSVCFPVCCEDGCSLGATVGFADGFADGCADVWADGCPDDCPVGFAEVGCPEGCPGGCLVGDYIFHLIKIDPCKSLLRTILTVWEIIRKHVKISCRNFLKWIFRQNHRRIFIKVWYTHNYNYYNITYCMNVWFIA